MSDKKSIYESLANVQAQCESLAKDAKGYNYSYTNIDSILKMLRPFLKEEKACVLFDIVEPTSEGKSRVATLTYYQSGESVTVSCPFEDAKVLAKGNNYQELGAMITYLRRYLLQSMFNLSSEDNDAQGLTVKSVKNEAKAKPKGDGVFRFTKGPHVGKTLVEVTPSDLKAYVETVEAHMKEGGYKAPDWLQDAKDLLELN